MKMNEKVGEVKNTYVKLCAKIERTLKHMNDLLDGKKSTQFVEGDKTHIQIQKLEALNKEIKNLASVLMMEFGPFGEEPDVDYTDNDIATSKQKLDKADNTIEGVITYLKEISPAQEADKENGEREAHSSDEAKTSELSAVEELSQYNKKINTEKVGELQAKSSVLVEKADAIREKIRKIESTLKQSEKLGFVISCKEFKDSYSEDSEIANLQEDINKLKQHMTKIVVDGTIYVPGSAEDIDIENSYNYLKYAGENLDRLESQLEHVSLQVDMADACMKSFASERKEDIVNKLLKFGNEKITDEELSALEVEKQKLKAPKFPFLAKITGKAQLYSAKSENIRLREEMLLDRKQQEVSPQELVDRMDRYCSTLSFEENITLNILNRDIQKATGLNPSEKVGQRGSLPAKNISNSREELESIQKQNAEIASQLAQNKRPSLSDSLAKDIKPKLPTVSDYIRSCMQAPNDRSQDVKKEQSHDISK